MGGEVNEFAFWGEEMGLEHKSDAPKDYVRRRWRRILYEQCTCLSCEFVRFNQNRMHLLIKLYDNMSSHLR